MNSDQWLQYVDEKLAKNSHSHNGLATATGVPMSEELSGGARSLKVLPFSREVFLRIASRFFIHDSAVRTISRADIPVFSSANVYMGEREGPRYPAYGNYLSFLINSRPRLTDMALCKADTPTVYNCRTTNSWPMDLAYMATFFPHCRLTFGILFGCPFSIEKQIVNRLSYATKDVAHPLLIPGIFAELERTRQIHIIESAIDKVETRILTVDSSPEDMDAMPASMKEADNQAKRTQWLDTTYLRNQLISWNTQLKKLASHTDELSEMVFSKQNSDGPLLRDQARLNRAESEEHNGASDTHLRRVGAKIRDRVQEIIDEYDAKIRDCTMRVDGMAMATQWVRYTIPVFPIAGLQPCVFPPCCHNLL